MVCLFARFAAETFKKGAQTAVEWRKAQNRRVLRFCRGPNQRLAARGLAGERTFLPANFKNICQLAAAERSPAAVSPPAFCSCRSARRQKRRSGFARKNARLCHTCRRGWFWGQYILLTKGGGGKGLGAKGRLRGTARAPAKHAKAELLFIQGNRKQFLAVSYIRPAVACVHARFFGRTAASRTGRFSIALPFARFAGIPNRLYDSLQSNHDHSLAGGLT